MTDKEMIGVRVEPEKREEIEERLEWGDTLTEWCLGAFEMKLYIDHAADDHPELPDGWWKDAINDYLREEEDGVEEGNTTAATATN